MLSPQAVAVTAEPDGRSAPEVSLDARVRRCRVGTTGNQRHIGGHVSKESEGHVLKKGSAKGIPWDQVFN